MDTLFVPGALVFAGLRADFAAYQAQFDEFLASCAPGFGSPN